MGFCQGVYTNPSDNRPQDCFRKGENPAVHKSLPADMPGLLSSLYTRQGMEQTARDGARQVGPPVTAAASWQRQGQLAHASSCLCARFFQRSVIPGADSSKTRRYKQGADAGGLLALPPTQSPSLPVLPEATLLGRGKPIDPSRIKQLNPAPVTQTTKKSRICGQDAKTRLERARK